MCIVIYYRDLIELRLNRWIPRREEEKAKTMEEVRIAVGSAIVNLWCW